MAVLEPNVRGSSGYGKTFLDLDNGRLREDSVKDMAAAIDWISTQPALDVHRVLVMGSRHGGYMALAASTLLADRIAGAISVGASATSSVSCRRARASVATCAGRSTATNATRPCGPFCTRFRH